MSDPTYWKQCPKCEGTGISPTGTPRRPYCNCASLDYTVVPLADSALVIEDGEEAAARRMYIAFGLWEADPHPGKPSGLMEILLAAAGRSGS